MLAMTRDTTAVAGYIRVYNYTKIQGPQFKSVMRTWHIILLIAESKLHAHHKTHKFVYNKSLQHLTG